MRGYVAVIERILQAQAERAQLVKEEEERLLREALEARKSEATKRIQAVTKDHSL